MRTNKKEAQFDMKTFGEGLVIQFLEDAIRTGKVDIINDPESLERFLETLRKQVEGEEEFSLLTVIDHRGTVLKEARKFAKADNEELALLLFATWIEHFVNSLLEGRARSLGLTHNEIAEIFRSTSMKAKIGGLLPILSLPRMTPKKQTTIVNIMEARNAFVHYKWKFENPDEAKPDKDLRPLLVKIEGVVRYLQRYEVKYVLHLSPRDLKHRLMQLETASRDKLPVLPNN